MNAIGTTLMLAGLGVLLASALGCRTPSPVVGTSGDRFPELTRIVEETQRDDSLYPKNPLGNASATFECYQASRRAFRANWESALAEYDAKPELVDYLLLCAVSMDVLDAATLAQARRHIASTDAETHAYRSILIAELVRSGKCSDHDANENLHLLQHAAEEAALRRKACDRDHVYFRSLRHLKRALAALDPVARASFYDNLSRYFSQRG